MSDGFDAHYQWLGIPPKDQPPHHYRLLGIAVFEDDADVIENAADRQMIHLRSFQAGKNAEQCQRLLNEVAAARIALLDPDRRAAYDQSLQAQLQSPALPPEVGFS